MASSLLDETVTWAEFGRQHLDRRVTTALTDALGLTRPTLVQSRGIPVALEGKDLLCRARTGSGKTLCYGVPLVQRLLREAEAKGSAAPMGGLVLVPTKELIVQVHGVIQSLLTFCFDVLTVELLISGQKYMKAELPSILVTTPSSLVALLRQRQGTMTPLAESLKLLVIDEADLMFSFGYEEDIKSLCALLPATYQAMLVSATLSEEVEHLKGLMLHKPVLLKLEEPRVTGKLAQFYIACHKTDKYLILYTLLKLQLVQGKILMFVKSVEAAYKVKILLERFSINSAVLNAELPHASRQNIIQSFNQSLVELLIATDDGFTEQNTNEEEDESDGDAHGDNPQDAAGGTARGTGGEVGELDGAVDGSAGAPKVKTKGKKRRRVAEDPPVDAEGQEAEPEAQPVVTKRKLKKRKKQAAGDVDDDQPGDKVEIAAPKVEVERRRLGQRRRATDEQFSLTRGVDLQGVTTVINVDVPVTVRSYIHRVGRCARGGASGTALTLCTDEEEALLQRIIRAQASASGTGALRPLPMQVSDAERFRYRVEDMARGLTKKAVAQYRARELQLEALNSEKLKAYFEEHPDEKLALQRTQRALRERKSVRQHLRHVPGYLVPEQLFTTATPVQQAVRDEAAAQGGTGRAPAAVRRKRLLQARKQDPLQGFAPGSGKKKSMRNLRFSRAAMEAKDRRINPKTANVEELPPLSGRKLWKLRHGKRVRSRTDVLGERKRLTPGQRKRHKKFGF